MVGSAQALEFRKAIVFADSTRFSPPALGVDGKVYVGIQDFGIGWYDPKAGTKKQEALGGSVISGPTIGLDGRVYVGINAPGRANFFALDPQSLARDWGVALAGRVATSAAVGPDGSIFVGTTSGDLYRLSPQDGRILWRTDVGGVTCSPSIGRQGDVYVVHGKHLLAVQMSNGRVRWQYPTDKGTITATPALASDGTVYCGDNQGVVRALTPQGALRWSRDLGRAVISGLTLGEDGTVFLGVAGPFVHALRPDGTLRWSQPTAGEVRSSPVVSNDGQIHLVEGRSAVTRTAANGFVVDSLDRRGVLDDDGRKVTVTYWAEVGDGLLTHAGMFWFCNGKYLWAYKVGGSLAATSSYPMAQGDLCRSGRIKPTQARVFAPSTALSGTFQGALLGIPGKTYDIQRTSDLVTWTPLDRVTTHNGVVPFRRTGLTVPSREFFRAVELP